MNDISSFKKETSKSGIDASVSDGTPVPQVEPSIFSARPETGSQPDLRNEQKLVWPPLADDLRRLYLEQKLSAMKIAKVYRLKYPSDKTAESTILYHLKRNGIARRDCAAHVRKVTDAMVDDWVTRYQNGESLKQIAGGSVDPVTVFYHLHRRGLQLRDKVEAQIKAVRIHDQVPFDGSPNDRAYIVGISRGDYWVQRHGRAVRVRLGTTHPAMASLFRQLFSKHGPIYEYPKRDVLTGYEWMLDCDLESSFEYLMQSKSDASEYIHSRDLFMSFLAGFFDAEGTVYLHHKRYGDAFELSISNTDAELLRAIARELSRRGFQLKLEQFEQNRERALASGIKNPGEYIWRIAIWRFEDVRRLMEVMPLRHPEKVAKVEIALRFARLTGSKERNEAISEWKQLLRRIRYERDMYVAKARAVYEQKADSKSASEPNTGSIS